ncbi:kinase [Veronia nyctiphanis]|uniref:Kinase n=1 Tax=Veronia nyctiphanis TaxID=1278244 RepID=A0A4Q0YRF3_9GAMM|nr:AAA family ATPase [Veronia nyctiphanis]RXJ73183.1 kinase [Veronia nyctiphanis]
MKTPTLYIFSGLPAVGKSTLAQLLSKQLCVQYIRIDTVEQGLRDLCGLNVECEGYQLSYRIIHDNLSLGLSVISDSCNTEEFVRREWEQVATKSGANFVNIEVICSNPREHERRARTRKTSVENLQPPSWDKIQNRVYEPWNSDVITIDTASRSINECLNELMKKLCLQ